MPVEIGSALLLKIATVLGAMIVVYTAVNGIKDAFPAWTAAHSGALRIFNAVGALLAAMLICVGGSHPEAGKSIFELLPCVGTAVTIFLGAAGIHQAKSASDTAREAGAKK